MWLTRSSRATRLRLLFGQRSSGMQARGAVVFGVNGADLSGCLVLGRLALGRWCRSRHGAGR